MTETRIGIVTTSRQGQPDTSANILTEMVSHGDDSWRVQVHSIVRPDLPGENSVTAACEVGIVALRALATAIRLRRRADIVVVNKTLSWDLVDAVFGVPLYERLFLSHGGTVYATMDADYVPEPTKTRALFENADLVLATSRAIYERATTVTSPDRVVLVSPSVDTDFFVPAVSESRADENLVLGWVGGADYHQENLRSLVTCLEAVEADGITIRLLLGGGSLPDGVRNRLDEMGFDVDVIGYVPWEDVPEVINSIDVGLVPLQDTEFNRGKSSQKVREYMACGVPVIASDVGENPHLIPENAGVLVDGPDGWADAVALLSDDETRAEMGAHAREHVEEQYAVPVVAEQIKEAFDRIR